jgi:hypothetical protein
MQGWKAAFPNV